MESISSVVGHAGSRCASGVAARRSGAGGAGVLISWLAGAVWVYVEGCGGFMRITTGGGDGAAISSVQEGFGLHNSDEQQPKSTGKPTNPTTGPRFMYVGKKDARPPQVTAALPAANRYRGIHT
jgi:hypothetical protein